MKKEITITLNAEETETYECCLKSLSYIPISAIKPIGNTNSNTPIPYECDEYTVSREFMHYVEQIINIVSGEEFNFID